MMSKTTAEPPKSFFKTLATCFRNTPPRQSAELIAVHLAQLAVVVISNYLWHQLALMLNEFRKLQVYGSRHPRQDGRTDKAETRLLEKQKFRV